MNQIGFSYPERFLTLYDLDKSAGTYDYFTEAIMGKAKRSPSDYVLSKNNEALVIGVAQAPNVLGYFYYFYCQYNQDKLKAIAIDNGGGGVLPSTKTV